MFADYLAPSVTRASAATFQVPVISLCVQNCVSTVAPDGSTCAGPLTTKLGIIFLSSSSSSAAAAGATESYTVSSMVTNDLWIPGANAIENTFLTCFAQNIPASASKGFNYFFKFFVEIVIVSYFVFVNNITWSPWYKMFFYFHCHPAVWMLKDTFLPFKLAFHNVCISISTITCTMFHDMNLFSHINLID